MARRTKEYQAFTRLTDRLLASAASGFLINEGAAIHLILTHHFNFRFPPRL
jgi:hypothetical protein